MNHDDMDVFFFKKDLKSQLHLRWCCVFCPFMKWWQWWTDRWLIPTNMAKTNVPFWMCCLTSAQMTDWNSRWFFKKGDSVIRTPEVDNFASLPRTSSHEFSVEKKNSGANLLLNFPHKGEWIVANSQLWGQTWGPTPCVLVKQWFAHLLAKKCVVSPQFFHIFTMYCACITHCITTCSTYKNIQVNIWLLGSWHWSLKKNNIDIFLQKMGPFGWIHPRESPAWLVCDVTCHPPQDGDGVLSKEELQSVAWLLNIFRWWCFLNFLNFHPKIGND